MKNRLLGSMVRILRLFRNKEFCGYDANEKEFVNTYWEFNNGCSIADSQSEVYGVGIRFVVKFEGVPHVGYLTEDGVCEIETGDEAGFTSFVKEYLG